MSTTIRTITADDLPTLLAQDRPVLIDIATSWCGPCRLLTPMLERLIDEAGEAIDVVKIDAEQSPTLANRLGVSSLPTLLVFSDAELVARQSGKPARYRELLELVRPHLRVAPLEAPPAATGAG